MDIENLNTNRIVPVYSLTERVTQKWLRKVDEAGCRILGTQCCGCPAGKCPFLGRG